MTLIYFDYFIADVLSAARSTQRKRTCANTTSRLMPTQRSNLVVVTQSSIIPARFWLWVWCEPCTTELYKLGMARTSYFFTSMFTKTDRCDMHGWATSCTNWYDCFIYIIICPCTKQKTFFSLAEIIYSWLKPFICWVYVLQVYVSDVQGERLLQVRLWITGDCYSD